MAGRVKGFVLASRKALVVERFGEAAWARILAELPAESRGVLSGLILPVSWHPIRICHALDEAIIRTLGGSSEAAFKSIGRKSADDNLTRFQAGLLKGKGPAEFLSQAPMIYRMYYESGARRWEPAGDRAGVLVTTGAEGVTYGDCLTVVGWHERALELTGARNPRVTHPVCAARGGTECRYEIRWE